MKVKSSQKKNIRDFTHATKGWNIGRANMLSDRKN